MDFRSRGTQPQANNAQPGNSGAFSGNPLSKISGKNSFLDHGTTVLLIAGALLIGALAFLLHTGNTSGQGRAVQTDRYQAVFLNNGQVYFGKIKGLNDQFIDLKNIYYLQTNGAEGAAAQATSNSNVSLVKLGCELHAPYDQMIINHDQVIFWENLQDSSQVVKAINEYKKQNPKGQTCSAQSQNSTQQAPATGTDAPAAQAPATQAPAQTPAGQAPKRP